MSTQITPTQIGRRGGIRQNSRPLVLSVICCVCASSAHADIRYARDVAPILSRHCFECHGPDAVQRQAGLRLDLRESATQKLESGHAAVAPGNLKKSELLRRVLLMDGDRMPPPDAGKGLSAKEITILREWIRNGARWESHWAFQRPTRAPLPTVQNERWVHNPVDRFVLARLEAEGLKPASAAERRVLIRRASFDLLGIPPKPEEVATFVADERPDAWERLIDSMLASPLYGQRWGRHWLDVARYGDSNGGDENHAHPLAFRYRDYVIDAFNEDLPFRTFVIEQLAGDLLDRTLPRRDPAVTATGFLAIGMKILAEKDKVKMRADLVDEQIDTIGKSLLGLTLACARCHDHKFDPIPTTDYYSLAGILHSTKLGYDSIRYGEYKKAKAAYDQSIVKIKADRTALEKSFTGSPNGLIDRQAESFDRGNVSKITDGYGKGIGIISDPGAQQNFAEFEVEIAQKRRYLIQVRYAAKASRSGRILINGRVAREKAISEVTGGWYPKDQKWFFEGTHEFAAGENVLRIESSPLMSHIDRFRLIPVKKGTDVAKTLARIDEIDARLATLAKDEPKETRIMAAIDGDAHDVKVHKRGSHLQLGAEVRRGSFAGQWIPSSDGSPNAATKLNVADKSGRLKLAQWMTDADQGVGGQTARVIANRVWHWHFGRGLVMTPDNFGMQGTRPTHPKLLDWLARELIDNDWSLKSLHRRILLSATWQQTTHRDAGHLYAGMPRQRLDAESIRDSLLLHADRLDVSLTGVPLPVKSQDPAPEDLHRNDQYYRNSRRRSVYLPVIRSHTYRFLTIFDFPNASTPVGRRDSTTVPTQALLLMNDPFVLEQAEALARRMMAIDHLKIDDDHRIDALYKTLFSRSPTAGELKFATEFLSEFLQTTDQEVDSWTALCHALFSSSEFVYVE
ncbi:MAG: hypothetical protein CMJ78_04485 [Planctomycetaceae bacterium]|nr:hypothetical protein [Planctomycetaceae bacterium]